MASPKLEARERKINEIRRLNGLSSFKGSEFKAMEYRDKINHKILNEEFGIEFYDDSITLPDGQRIHDIYQIEEQYNATESFFGISFDDNKTLLHDISCIDYAIGKTIYDYQIKSDKKNLEDFENDVLEQLEKIEQIPYIKNVYATGSYLKGTNKDECFYNGCYIDIQQKFKDWEQYCIFVDNIKDFISMFILDFEKLSGQKKFEWIEKLNANHITADIGEYINDYHLNQHRQAKIDMLINLELPNLTDPDTIARFVDLYIKQKSIK